MNEVTSIGNEGFRIHSGSANVYIDAFYYSIADIADAPVLHAKDVTAADLILVTHAHMDHFKASDVAEVACRTGATVVGPGAVIHQLVGQVPIGALKEMEPPEAEDSRMSSGMEAALPCATVTAFRTFHARGHNSYLVEMPRFRFFHDGDNEDTTRLPASALRGLDALLIGPWKGSGWVEFIEKVSPTRYFLMHLNGEELREHEAGRFLPDICERVPEGLVVLRPGQTFVFSASSHALEKKEKRP